MAQVDPELFRKHWHVESADDHVYPPKHFAFVLSSLIWISDEDKLLSRILFYYMLDLGEFIGMNTTCNRGQ